MNRFREAQKRGKSPAESFLIGQIDLLPWNRAYINKPTNILCVATICDKFADVEVTHGTYVMLELAKFLGEQLNK